MMKIDLIIDTVCPWCFIGKRRLARALAQRPQIAARVRLVWRPFLLNPDLPAEGMPRSAYLDRKFGGPGRVARMLAGLKDAGAAEGIAFNFPAIQRTPNSLNSHRLIRLAESRGLADTMVEALFSAYFEQGQDLGAIESLAQIAQSVGLAAPEVTAFLHGEDDRGSIFLENAQTHRLNVNGVPCFIFNDAYAIAGAQDPEILVRMIDLAHEASLDARLKSRLSEGVGV